MFIDELRISIRAGKGGDGIVSWLHVAGKDHAGPNGGNGGKGGDVYVKAVPDIGLLAKYKHVKEFSAEDGENGRSKSMQGKGGDDLEILLPTGSFLTNLSTGKTYDLGTAGQSHLILKGGNGGFGNEHFKGPTNRTPMESTPGKPGEEAEFDIELRLVADAGIIGLPNAGKSSLLNALTRAGAKVGSYQFTTLEPNLGGMYGRILADIPGLIEGASEGRGLGHKFLRHIRRTHELIHCVSVENDDVRATYEIVRKELENYSGELAAKDEAIVLTKSDCVDKETLERKRSELEALGKPVLVVSVIDDESLKRFRDELSKLLA